MCSQSNKKKSLRHFYLIDFAVKFPKFPARKFIKLQNFKLENLEMYENLSKKTQFLIRVMKKFIDASFNESQASSPRRFMNKRFNRTAVKRKET